MKNKTIGILIIIVMLAIVPTTIFAYGRIDTNVAIGQGGAGAITSSIPMTERILGTVQVAGSIISVIALIIIGMRYMFSSIEDKAQMKGVIGYYITGCILVFATTNVLAFFYDVLTGLDSNSNGGSTSTTQTVPSTSSTRCSVCNGSKFETFYSEYKSNVDNYHRTGKKCSSCGAEVSDSVKVEKHTFLNELRYEFYADYSSTGGKKYHYQWYPCKYCEYRGNNYRLRVCDGSPCTKCGK